MLIVVFLFTNWFSIINNQNLSVEKVQFQLYPCLEKQTPAQDKTIPIEKAIIVKKFELNNPMIVMSTQKKLLDKLSTFNLYIKSRVDISKIILMSEGGYNFT